MADKARQKVLSRKYYESNTEKVKWSARFHRFDLTKEAFFQLFEKQNGKCAVCKEPFKGIWGKDCHVDHDHETNKVRGLLCMPCNVGIGMLGDNEEGLNKALQYVRGESVG